MKQERIHVLLVEDEDAHAELIRRAFESQDEVIQLTVAKSLEEARNSLVEEIPDLAIVDLFLPDGKGLELLDESSRTDYPVVIMTSHGDEEVAVEAMKAGALQYVVKSEIALAELPHKVETALRQWGHIVERKQAEKAMRESEEHFRSLIENALEIIVTIDTQGRIRYASPSFDRVFGYAPEERIGRPFVDLVHESDRTKIEELIAQAFVAPPTVSLHYRHRRKDGSWCHLEAVGSSYVASTGVRHGVINSRDVTDRHEALAARQELEGRLRHSQKWEIVANLSRSIAREFNNMLTPVLEAANLALQSAEEGSASRNALERVLEGTGRARRLAERIAVLSRPLDARSVDLHELVERQIGRLRSTLPDSVELRVRLTDEPTSVLADPDHLEEILSNLCSNSLHAMRDRGGVLEIDLDVAEDEARVRLTVRDSGHGMSETTAKRALEAFFTTKGPAEAAGLGLSVVNAIVASHGGALTVSSQPDQGTTIHVDLPRT